MIKLTVIVVKPNMKRNVSYAYMLKSSNAYTIIMIALRRLIILNL